MFFYSMVIVWPNPGASVTLSQRKASGFVMPMPDRHPQRVAALAAHFPSSALHYHPLKNNALK